MHVPPGRAFAVEQMNRPVVLWFSRLGWFGGVLATFFFGVLFCFLGGKTGGKGQSACEGGDLECFFMPSYS